MAATLEVSGLDAAARRNLIVLAAGMAALYGMVELVFGVAALTFEDTGGSESLTGLAPAIFLACAALAALPAGRAMDRSGRRPVLAAGFAAGLTGCLLAALGVSIDSLPPALLGFALTGAATGTVLLSRAAAADMFRPERRPRAIALVLFGAVFGALLGPLVFGPLLGDGEDTSALDLAWLGGAGFMTAGLIVVSRLRPDPSEIAAQLGAASGDAKGPPDGNRSAAARSLREIASTHGVAAPLLAVLASLAGMVTAMSLVGGALIDHGHEHGAVFPVLAAHFVGMFAFFAVVGRVIERIGRVNSIVVGLLVLAGSCLGLAGTIDSLHFTALVLFGVGVGWSLSFVAATAELSERAASRERATLIGFADLLGNLSGAALVAAGGFVLAATGIAAVAIGAAAPPALAALWIFRTPAPSPAAAP
jgi:MFS family permease